MTLTHQIQFEFYLSLNVKENLGLYVLLNVPSGVVSLTVLSIVDEKTDKFDFKK